MVGAHSTTDGVMPVLLRGHHFLCMLTYKGMGYSKPFVTNMSVVIARIAHGAPVQLVAGPDAICGGLTDACRSASGHDCHASDTVAMDQMAIEAVSAELQRDIGLSAAITANEVAVLRAAFTSGAIRKACVRCPWFDTCTSIAEGGYEGVHL
jgi:uncharacterized protein